MTKEYKEGDSVVSEENQEEQVANEGLSEPTPIQPKASTSEGRKINTAVLLLQFEDGAIDAIVDLSNIEKARVATSRDVRLLCQEMAANMNNMITAKMVVAEHQMSAARQQFESQMGAIKNKLGKNVR